MLVHHLTSPEGKEGIEAQGFRELSDDRPGDKHDRSSVSNSEAFCWQFCWRDGWWLDIDIPDEVLDPFRLDRGEDYSGAFNDVPEPMLWLVPNEVLNRYRQGFTFRPSGPRPTGLSG